MNGKSIWKYFALLGLSAGLTALVVIFGAIPMRMIRRAYGRLYFWLGHLALAGGFAIAGQWPAVIAIVMLSCLVGLYVEAEEHGAGVFSASVLSISGTLGGLVAVIALWSRQVKVSVIPLLHMHADKVVKEFNQISSRQLESEAVLQWLPAGAVITLIFSLAVALIYERRASRWLGLGQATALRERLMGFRIPDPVIWVLFVAALGALLQPQGSLINLVSVNVLSILAVVYFFQGLAVAASTFLYLRIGLFWQICFYMMVIIQKVFFLVVIVGLLDFWLEFRTRLAKRPLEQRKEI